MKCDVSFSQGSVSTLFRWGEHVFNVCVCKNVLPVYSSAKTIKRKRVSPELWSQMYCHVFFVKYSVYGKTAVTLSVRRLNHLRAVVSTSAVPCATESVSEVSWAGTECGFSTWNVFAAGHPLIAETMPFHQSTCPVWWCCLREVQMNTRLYRAFLLITRRSWYFSHCYSERDSVQCSIAKWNLRVSFSYRIYYYL